MPLPLFKSHDEIQVIQKDLHLDKNVVEDAESLEENLPSATNDVSDDEKEKEKAEMNPRTKTLTFSEVYVPDVVARRTAIRRDTTLGRHRH